MGIMDRPLCRCTLPARGRYGDIYRCGCKRWWTVDSNRPLWIPISIHDLEKMLLTHLAEDITAFENGQPMPNWKHSQ